VVVPEFFYLTVRIAFKSCLTVFVKKFIFVAYEKTVEEICPGKRF